MIKLNAMVLGGLAAVLAVPVVEAAITAPAVPMPPVVTYGLMRNEFGAPLADDDGAVARLVKASGVDTVYAQGTIAANVYRGMNYRLSLEIDSKGPVRSRAVTVGTSMTVKLLVDDGEQPLTPSPTWTTPKAGTPQRKDYTIGVDTDGDGIPDDWELWMMAFNLDAEALDRSDEELIRAFRPDGDEDGDGMSNLAEFLAGTDPFDETLTFGIKGLERVSAEVVALSFSTVRGRQYRVLMAERADGAWSSVATAANPDAAFAYEAYEGNNDTVTVYVDAALASAFFKVVCY